MAVLHTPRRRARHWAVIRPAWVPPWASVAFDFANNRSYGDEWRQRLTVVRASTADYADRLNGLWQVFPAATPRITDKGLLIEAAATNVVIQNRDLTQAAWVTASMTAAKDQIGVDGVANSASSITSTGANGTILQTDVLGSSSRCVSAFVKRITGTGTIQLTGDGATFTTIAVTSDWTRVNLAAATVVNPVTGFKIVTSGDKVAVDFVQNETGPIVTSPILTGAAAVTRSLDSVLMRPLLPSWFNPLEGTIFAEVSLPNVNTGIAQTLFSFDDNSNNNRIQPRESGGTVSTIVVTATATQANTGNAVAVVANTPFKVATAYRSNSFNTASSGGSFGTLDSAGTVPTVTQFRFGNGVSSPINGYIKAFAYGGVRVSDAALVASIAP